MKKIVGYLVVILIFLIVVLFGWGFIAEDGINTDIKKNAQKYCREERVVYVCGANIKVVSLVPGSGFMYYRSDGTNFTCPVVGPDSMSEDCKNVSADMCEIVCDSR